MTAKVDNTKEVYTESMQLTQVAKQKYPRRCHRGAETRQRIASRPCNMHTHTHTYTHLREPNMKLLRCKSLALTETYCSVCKAAWATANCAEVEHYAGGIPNDGNHQLAAKWIYNQQVFCLSKFYSQKFYQKRKNKKLKISKQIYF